MFLPTQVVLPVLLLLYLPSYVGRQWNGDADGYQLSFLVPLQGQLLLVTMVIGLLPMGNGNADWNNSGSCCGGSSWYIYYASRSGFNNGEWKCVQPSCFLAGTLHQLLVTIVVGLVSWVMENGEGCVVPAARDAGRAPCLFANWGKDNGQWSQWMEQRFLGRCTVSFEGRSWL